MACCTCASLAASAKAGNVYRHACVVAELTSQDVDSIASACPASEGDCWACCSPVVYALKTWVTPDDLVIVITTMLGALRAAMPNGLKR